MLTNFISDAANAVRDPVFSTPEIGGFEERSDTMIKVNVKRVRAERPSTDIYDRARKIYYRARRTGTLSLSAGIF